MKLIWQVERGISLALFFNKESEKQKVPFKLCETKSLKLCETKSRTALERKIKNTF